jgi:hypothetical protein
LSADRFFCSYSVIAALLTRAADVVVRLHPCGTTDFHRGRRLGPADDTVISTKPDLWLPPNAPVSGQELENEGVAS